MRQLRKLTTEAGFVDYARICVNAYPDFDFTVDKLSQHLLKASAEDDTSQFWGIYEGPVMVGGMRLLDLEMNYFGRMIRAGGVGLVAVDLINRKKGVAKDLVQFHLDKCERRGQSLTLLYPFRPDFYHRMGFGYGPKMNRYTFLPSSLPRATTAGEIVYLTTDDLEAMAAFSARAVARQHGYCRRGRRELSGLVKGFGEARTLVGYRRDGELRGYIAFRFKRAHDTNKLKNDLIVREWLWEDPEALAALCSFLNSLADEVNRIVYATFEPDLHYLLKDARNGSDNVIPSVYHETNTAGVGLMYRIVSLEEFLDAARERDWNGVSADLRLEVTDTFRPGNAGAYALKFKKGRLEGWSRGGAGPRGGAGAIGEATALAIDIADLSSLMIGSVDVATLYRLGRIGTAPGSFALLGSLFRAAQAPECITEF